MTSFYHTIKQILSDKKTSVFIILLALVARIVQLTFFYNIRVDGMYQVLAMQNFADGHGISTSQVLSSDLSKTVYEPLINWPPGYSLLLSPFYILFNHNYILAGIVLDLLAALGLIFFTRRILRVMEVPTHLINIFTLLTGFFIYYFYFINSSDAIAISFFVMAVYFTLLLLKKDTLSLKTILPLIICLFLSGLIKYLFIPVVFGIPIFLFLKGNADKKRAIQKSGIILFSCLAIMLGGVLLWQKIISGSAAYVSASSRGFFPENLANSYPFIPASFINPDSIGLVVPDNSGFYKIIYRTFQGITLLLSLASLTCFAIRIMKKGFTSISQPGNFFYLSFFLTAAIVLLLIILSIRVGKEENYPGHWWTYAEEPRYYGLIAVFIHLSVFILYHYRKNWLIRSKYIFIFLILLLLPETFRGIFFTAKRMTNAGQEEYSWQHEREIQDYADHIIKKTINRKEGEAAVVTGSSYYINYRVGLYSHIPVFSETEKINSPALFNAKKPVMLLIILQDKDLPAYGPFLENNENELAGFLRGFYFYTLHVKPH